MKRTLKAAVLLVVLLAAAGTGTYFYIGRAGSSDLEQWIGRQVVGVIQSQITPKVTFESLDYQAPFTVIIEKLALTAESQPIIAIGRARLELAEVPSRGQPIRVKTIELTAPHILLMQRPSGGMVGWSDFVRSKPQRDAAPEGQRLSDVLRLQHVGIRDGQIVYHAGDGSQPMILPGIELDLDTPPAEASPGAYRLAGTLRRDPVFKIDFDGLADLDQGLLDVNKLELVSDMGEQQYSTLPPAIQQVLRDHQVKGRLTASVSGRLQLAEPARSNMNLRAELAGASVQLSQTVWPAERLVLTADAKEGKAAAKLEAAALGGSVRCDAHLALADPYSAELNWELADLRIENVLRILEEGQPRYAGRLGGNGQIKADLARLPESLSGPGRLQVRDGRLMQLAVLREILKLALKQPAKPEPSRRDTADVQFAWKADHVEITEAAVDSPALRLRGKGPIYYDQRLDLSVRAGVLQNVAKAFGEIGSLVGQVSEQAIQYHVGGTLAEPKVTPRPLGLGN